MIRALKHFRRTGAVLLTLALAACASESPLTAPETVLQTSVASADAGEPTLLYCPTSDSRTASKRVGPKGGVLSVGGTKLSIPAGAVPVETEFVLTLPASDYLEVDIVAGGQEHYSFSRPVSITVDYARCRSKHAEVEALSAWYVDSWTGDFLQNMGGVDSKARKKVTFETDHLSKYAIAW